MSGLGCGWEVCGPFFHVSWCCIGPWADPTALVESACGIDNDIACSVVINDFGSTGVAMFHHHSWGSDGDL